MFNSEEYYKLIRYSVQVLDVELVELYCKKNKRGNLGDSREISLKISREVGEVSDEILDVYLAVKLTGPDEFFDIELVYKGICRNLDKKLNEELFKEYAYNQIVPLLLPYARECISNTLARMQLPIYLIPTMDVLQTIEENKQSE